MALHFLGPFSSYDENGIPVTFQVKTDVQGGSVLDYVEVYYDDSLNTIRIFWWDFIDNRPVVPGEELFSATPPYTDAITENIYSSYQFCQGSDLVRFKSSKVFPFFFQETTSNHYLCEVIYCDVSFGNPIVVPATEESPGSIDIDATSSHGPIQYKLGEDFTYGYGSSSSFFDNLSPGDYVVYARDSKNCFAKKNVNVPIGNIYGLKYKTEYYDINGDATTINIYKNTYVGDYTQPVASGSPLTIVWGQRGQEKYNPIKGSEANISLISENDYQFLEIFTEGTQDFRIDILKNEDLIWRGFVIPEHYSEPYKEPPYPINISANDGLGDLKKIYFGYFTYSPNPYNPSQILKTFNKYTGRMSHMDVIHLCIKKLGLELPYYTGIAIYEDNMPVTAPYDPLYHIYVNADNYYINGVMNCYDVLIEQLKPYGARIYQANGHWNIVKFDQQIASYTRFKYSSSAVYQSSETFQPIINIASPAISNENIWLQNNMMLDVMPGYNLVKASQNLGYVENLIQGGDFNVNDFNEDGVLKHFTSYNNYIYISPIIYESKAVQVTDTTVNNGLSFIQSNVFNVLKAKSYSNTNVILFGEKAVNGVDCFEGDIVFLSGQYINIQNGLYAVKKDTWVKDTRGSFEVQIAFGYWAGYKFSYFRNSSNVVFISQISEWFLNAFAYIQTKPVNVEYNANDQFLFQINRKSLSDAQKGYMGLEIKIGNKYLADDFFFKDHYNFIEIELDNSGKFTIDEIVGNVGLSEGSGDLTIKFWWILKNIYAPGNYALVFDWMKAIYMPDGFDPEKEKLHTRTNSNKYRFVPDDIQVIHGDAPDVLNKDKIYSTYLTLANGNLTQNWHRKDFNESKNLLKLLLESIMSNNLKSSQLISGTIKQTLSLSNCIFDPSNTDRVFMIGSLEYNDKMVESTVELMELSLNGGWLPSFSSGFTTGFGGAFD